MAEQLISPLDAAQLDQQAEERAWLNALIASYDRSVQLTATASDLPVLHTLLGHLPFTDDIESELVIIGQAFGDVLAHELGLIWVDVQDEYGRDMALKHPDRHVLCFPRDMLIKRYEAGEAPDSFNLQHLMTELGKSIVRLASEAKASD